MEWVDWVLASRGAALLAGIALLVATTLSVLRTIVIPRALRSVIADAVSWTVITTTRAASRWHKDYQGRDAVLAWTGPVILLGQLVTWLVLYLLAYGLVIYGVGSLNLAESIREAGSSLFTLGFASVDTDEQTALNFMAAATGPIVIAMMIGFLPNVYSIYVDREVNVTTLSASGGEPAWGPEYLVRHHLSSRISEMPDDFLTWAQWACRLRMTHITYPVLIWVRSARSTRHYAVALLAVLDAAAMHIAVTSQGSRREASRLVLEAGQACEVLHLVLSGKQSMRRGIPFVGKIDHVPGDIRRAERELPSWNAGMTAVHIAADQDIIRGFDTEGVEELLKGDAEPLQITRADFDYAYAYLKDSGYPITNDIDSAWEQFRCERARYEFPALELCRRLDATPAPWSGIRNVATPSAWPSLAGQILSELGGDEAT